MRQMPENNHIGEAIRRARRALRMTQQQLAEAVELPAPQTVSSIERGEREVKAAELVRLARALHRSVDELLGLETRSDVRVLWRRGTEQASVEREAKLVERARRYALIEKWSNASPADELPEYELNLSDQTWLDRFGYAEVGRLAPRLGRVLDLGSRPAASLQAVLEERFGLKLFFEELGEEESAACTRGDFGFAVLMNAREAPWRRNFNLAHELFHLVTWSSFQRAWPEGQEPATFATVEKLANAFASHLLLPATELESQFNLRFPNGETNDIDLIELAREFGVSTEALLWRLKLLGKLTQKEVEAKLGDAEFRRKDRRTMPDYWDETAEGPLPERYVRLAKAAYAKGEITLARLAQLLETSVGEVAEFDLGKGDGEEAAASPA